MIQKNNGELFEGSAMLGATYSGCGVDIGTAIAEVGRRLGRAYQIFDDIIDCLGDESAIGKTLGTDLASGKFTLPEILFLQKLDAPAQERFLADIAAGTLGAREIVAKMRNAGIFDECREYFLRETQAAADALAPYAGTPGARHLLAISEFVAAQVKKIA